MMRGSVRRALLVQVAVLLLAPPAALAQEPVPAPTPAPPEVARSFEPAPRVVGGAEVSPPGKYPWIVSITRTAAVSDFAGHFCGGTVLTSEWILSAAHCFANTVPEQNVFPPDIAVVIGRHDLTDTGSGVRHLVDDIVIHESFGGADFFNDIAMIKLATPTAATPVTRATEADSALWADPEDGTVIGWGDTDGIGPPWTIVPKLQEVDAPFVSNAECTADWGGFFFPSEDVCAGDEGTNKDSCVGDSGGPLFGPPGAGPWKQIGIVSFGPAMCGDPSTTAVYTRVSAFESWIDGVINPNTPPVADDAATDVIEDGTDAITLTGSDADGDPLTFSIVSGPSNGTLTGTPPNVTYTPDPDWNGADSFVFRVDDGRGGTDDGTISITVLASNDPPEFTIGEPALTIDEDDGPQMVTGQVSPMPPAAGPPTALAHDEGGQVVTPMVTNSNNPLFSAQPAIDGSGTLTYTPVADANGIATVFVTAMDDGGTANFGNDTTVMAFTITVERVNDAPSFTAGGPETVAEDSGPQSVPWATAISPGPPDEVAEPQSVSFDLTTDDPSLFSVQPAIDPSGTLTYTPAPDKNGTANVDVRLMDDGGTLNGGVDTSAPQPLAITITPVNDPPVAVGEVATLGDGETVDIAVLANDSDPDNDPLSVVVVTPPTKGTATVVAGPKVRYAHAGSGGGTDSFTYKANDGAADSNVVTVTITVADDGDGVPASIENGAPNGGDGNGDGTPDRRQGHVTSLPNAVDGTYATLVASGAAKLSSVAAFAQPAPPPPAGVTFPAGFFSYELAPVPTGGLAVVDLILHGSPSIDTFYKFGPTPSSPGTSVYHEFPATITGNTVRLQLTDGAVGDTDLAANGKVVDPGAPAKSAPPPPTPPPPPPPPPADLVGLVDPSSGRWHLRRANGDVTQFLYGNPNDIPFTGDWDCDGIDTPGLFRQSDAFAYLRNSNTQGIADIRFFFGDPNDVPLAGDFNGDGCDTLSIYRPGEGRFYIVNKLGQNDGGLGAADFSFSFGDLGDKPVVGDWDGDGVDEVGLHRESTGLFYWRNTLSTGIADGTIIFGDPGDRFVAGDWGTVDGKDTPAVFRPSAETFFFRFTLTQGTADAQFPFGSEPWLPVAGVFFG